MLYLCPPKSMYMTLTLVDKKKSMTFSQRNLFLIKLFKGQKPVTDEALSLHIVRLILIMERRCFFSPVSPIFCWWYHKNVIYLTSQSWTCFFLFSYLRLKYQISLLNWTQVIICHNQCRHVILKAPRQFLLWLVMQYSYVHHFSNSSCMEKFISDKKRLIDT